MSGSSSEVETVYVNGHDDPGVEPELEVKRGLLFQDETHTATLLHSLNMMRKNRTFCDVVLHVGNSELPAHRAVLASASPHLLEMFSADNDKGTRDSVVSYKLNGLFEKTALEKLIDYAYTSRLEVSPGEVKGVFAAAHHLKMERVSRVCANYLVENLTLGSCLDIRSLLGIIKDKHFLTQVDGFIAQRFEEISKAPNFLSLPCIKIEVLSQTRQEMDLVGCESLCLLALDWIRKYGQDDDLHMEHLLGKTHLLYLALDNSLQDCSEVPTGDVSDTELVRDYKKISLQSGGQVKKKGKGQVSAKPRVLVYKRHISMDADEVVQDWKLITSAKVRDHTFLALVSAEGKLATLSILMRFNPPSVEIPRPSREATPEETPLPPLYCELANMGSVKCGAGCANLHDNLLVCGGYDKAECLRSVELYSPLKNEWASLAPMLEARGRFNIAVVNGCVYAVGGCNGTTELATVERYTSSKKWERVASLPLARSNTGVCEVDGKIYCIGGWNGQAGIKQCDVFDPLTGQWETVSPLHTGRYQAAACGFNGEVFVVGGCDGWNCLNSVEKFNPATKEWTTLCPLVTGRRGCGLAVFKGKLYAVGGSDGAHSLSTTEVYDPEEGSWSKGPSMTTPRSNVGVAAIGNRLYAVGGFSGKTFLNTIEYLDETTEEWTTFSPSAEGSSP